MTLYLVQHGQARSKEEDPDRPLTREGLAATEAVARLFARLAPAGAEVWHSGKTRAEQTAAAFTQALGTAWQARAHQGLDPMDPVEPVAQELQSRGEALMIVGHLPHLSRLASHLLCGDPEAGTVGFRNSAVVCLTREEGSWQVSWLLTPELAVLLDDTQSV